MLNLEAKRSAQPTTHVYSISPTLGYFGKVIITAKLGAKLGEFCSVSKVSWGCVLREQSSFPASCWRLALNPRKTPRSHHDACLNILSDGPKSGRLISHLAHTGTANTLFLGNPFEEDGQTLCQDNTYIGSPPPGKIVKTRAFTRRQIINGETSKLLELRRCNMAACSFVHLCSSSCRHRDTRGEADN